MARIKKAQKGDTLSRKDLSALAHQKRGMGEIDGKFVKKSGGIKNELGNLTDYQTKQLKGYMDSASTSRKIYEGLPNAGRIFGKSAADIPKGSKLEKQRNGGKMKKAQAGGVVGKSTKKAPMVDPKGAFTKVQQRTIAGKKAGSKKK